MCTQSANRRERYWNDVRSQIVASNSCDHEHSRNFPVVGHRMGEQWWYDPGEWEVFHHGQTGILQSPGSHAAARSKHEHVWERSVLLLQTENKI